MTRKLITTAWARAALLFAMTACVLFVGPGDRDDKLRELVSARARWNANGMRDYEYVLQQKCFCVLGGVAVRVMVRGGSVVAAVQESTGEPVPANLASGYVAVEKLFDLLVDAIDRDAYRIHATYDPQFGFPSDFFIDFNQNVADEEMGYTATGFRPLR
jgi:hypothetical protein